MTRVLMTSARCFPKLGGVERHVEAIRRQISAMGHDVTVIELGEGLGAIRALPQLIKILRNAQYDVLHAHDFMPALVTWAAKHLTRSPANFYATIHGYEGYPLRRHYIAAHRIVNRLAEKVVAIGAYIDRWYGTRSHLVVHGGVEEAAAAPALESGRVVFIGRLACDTNSMEIAEAFSAAAKRHSHVRFTIYGFGPLQDAVNDMCRRNGVEFAGAAFEVSEILKSASVVVANSYLSILEAFSLGRPVLAYYGNPLKRDYISEIAQASSAVAAVGTPQELSAALDELIQDKGRRASLSKRGIAYASRLSWHNVANDYLNLWGVR
jgi:glycosyltransferase involved in cell wall biosynthesis